METRLPKRPRTLRGTRSEAAHTNSMAMNVPPMHFPAKARKAEVRKNDALSGEPSSVASSTQTDWHRSFVYFAQMAKTATPLFLADGIGALSGVLIAVIGVGSLFTNLPELLQIAPQLFSQSIVFLLIYGLLGLYPGVGINPIVELKSLVLGSLTAGAILAALSIAFGHWNLMQATFLGTLTCFTAVAVLLFRISVRGLCAQFSWWGQPALLVGCPESSARLMKVLTRNVTTGLRPVGFVCPRHLAAKLPASTEGFLGTLEDIVPLAEKHRVFWALLVSGMDRNDQNNSVFQYCSSISNVVVMPELQEFPSLWNQTRDFSGIMGIHHRERLLNPVKRIGKRMFDILAVLLGLLVLSPLLLLLLLFTWVCIRISSPGPVFYSQKRVGRNGRHFSAWKLRTMVVDAEAALEKYLQKHPEKRDEWDRNQKLQADPRILPGIGNFLRISSLDELPQLWNVLRGDMSLVGPRPFMPEQTGLYGDRLDLYYKVRPGVTGMWQISGRNHTTFEERANLDAYYVRNWSFWLDVFILGRTVKTVLFREGAF